MVILEDLHNQTSNQFVQFIHLSAYCKEHKIDFFHGKFINNYVKEYPALLIYQKSKINQLYLHLLSKIGRKLRILSIIWLDDDVLAEQYSKEVDLFKKRTVFCRGGRLRDNASVEKHRDFFRKIFKPDVDTIKLAELYLDSKHPVLGLHVRRTDYATYERGMYFFDDDVYIKYAKKVQEFIGKCKVILFTDDKQINFSKYQKELGNVVISRCSIAEDYYLMGRCNFLLSTNTTFTLVASYLGRSKLFRFMGPDEEIKTLNVFKECATLNHTEEEALRAELARQAKFFNSIATLL